MAKSGNGNSDSTADINARLATSAEDKAKAAKWFSIAATQGDTRAQFGLGLLYALGLGVTQDYVQSHMWLNLGSMRGDKDAIKNRNNIAELMTPAQVAKAQRLAREWMEKHPKKKK